MPSLPYLNIPLIFYGSSVMPFEWFHAVIVNNIVAAANENLMKGKFPPFIQGKFQEGKRNLVPPEFDFLLYLTSFLSKK